MNISPYLYPMNHLLLIEHAAHFEVARAYAGMFLAAGWEVTLAVNESNAGFLKGIFEGNERVSFLVARDNEDKVQYWSQVSELAERAKLVIVCSHENNAGGLVDKKWKTTSYLVIHDGFNYIDPLGHLEWEGGVRQWLRIVKYLVSGYFSKRIQSARQYDSWLTPVEWPEAWKHKCKMAKVLYLPFLWNEGNFPVKNDIFHIVVPGTINQRSRDYQLIKKLIQRLASTTIVPSCKITLLGKAASPAEIQLVNEMKMATTQNVTLVTFDNHLSTAHFDAIMRSADLLLLPLQPSWQYGVVKEIAGISCLSGNIGDMVRFGKRALVPKHYPLHPLIAKNVVYYDPLKEDELLDLIFNISPSPADYSHWNAFVIEVINTNWRLGGKS